MHMSDKQEKIYESNRDKKEMFYTMSGVHTQIHVLHEMFKTKRITCIESQGYDKIKIPH